MCRQRIFNELKSDPDIEAEHLDMRFVSSFSQARKASLAKAVELFRVIARAIRLRRNGKFDLLMYPAGGPQTVPMIRDILLLPVLMGLANHTIVNFHAAGIAERLDARSGIIEWLLKRVYCKVDAAVVMTSFNRRDPEALGVRSIVTMPHHLKDENPRALMPDCSLGAAPRFVYLGHLYDLKGTPQLIEAFGRVRHEHPEAKLCLIGEFIAPYSADAFQKDVREQGIEDAVEWIGSLSGEEKWQCLRGNNCFVFPSIAPYESFGLVMVEAMMFGMPLLVSDWRGNKDVVGEDFGGILFPITPSLVDGIERCLRQALERRDQWEKWGETNRLIYEKNYRVTGDCEDYVSWIKETFVHKSE
jgi:glycosyltransferase involved in cell wall biosynthesis